MNAGDDRTASCRIQDGRGSGGQVGFHAPLEMERELGVRQHVGIPVTPAWSPRNVYVSIDSVEPDLGAVELSGLPTASSNVDGTVACKDIFYPVVY
jgi:hypothetical protein